MMFSARTRGWVAGLAMVLAMLAWAPEAPADPKAKVTVTVIQARKGAPFLHSSLRPLWETLTKTFGDKFTAYDLVSENVKDLAVNDFVTAPLPGQGEFKAIYGGVTPDKGLLRVSIELGELRSKVRIHDGGVFFQAGRTQAGATTVVAVRAVLLK